MMWYRIDESKKSNKELYLEQIDEAANWLRDSMIDYGMYTESDNKYMKWLKDKLSKICPSPEKMKDFFKGIGQKIDAKIQNCKFDYVKNAWNNLKDMATADDCQEVSPEEAGIASQGGEQGQEDQGQEETGQEEQGQEGDVETPEADGSEEGVEDEEVAAESYYTEGFVDSIKSGWKKLTGQKEQPVKGKRTAKKGVAKKGTAKKGVANKGATKATAKKGKGKVKGKSKNKQTALQKILQFLKDHWKQIAVILIACLALYFLGAWIAAAFLKSPATKAACAAVTKTGFKLPWGMKALPKGAKLIANGVVRYANGSVLCASDGPIDDDF